jgi:hypothetical protein
MALNKTENNIELDYKDYIPPPAPKLKTRNLTDDDIKDCN